MMKQEKNKRGRKDRKIEKTQVGKSIYDHPGVT